MSGEVLHVGLVSVHIRTFDNRFVRVPNETLLKSNIINYTHFPIRRLDIPLGVAYKEDLDQVRELLLKLLDRDPHVLDEPEPMVRVTGFGESSMDLLILAWVDRLKFVDMGTGLRRQIKAALDEAGIEIPFPHRSLYLGSAQGPLPVRLTDDPGADHQ